MTAKFGWLSGRACKTFRAPAVKFFALSVVTFAGLTLLSTCGGGVAAGTVTAVTISPTAISVGLNQFTNFMAVATISNSTTPVSTVPTWLVNGMAGGDLSTIGSIVPAQDNPQVGIYTAPPTVPTTNNGTVMITATVPQNPSSTTDTTVVTSNTAIVTVGGGAGLVVSPSGVSIAAGSNFAFSATLNSLPDMNATWSVSSANGGDIGTIDPHTGNYQAPNFPPPGAVITVTAMDSGDIASVTATIVFSNNSFKGPFAFSYTGNDTLGFLAVAGSLVADGSGGIISGVEDIQSFVTGISKQVQIRGNYVVGPDGRTNVKLNVGLPTASTLQFALTNNLHGQLIRFDATATGGGTIDQQTVTDLTNSNLVISGPYVFDLLGLDLAFKPLGMAGKFTANAGQISATGSILDVNDNGAVTSPPDTSLAGTYSFDPMFPGTGRGTLTLTSTTINSRTFAFYIVDSTHLRLLEIDGNSYLEGDVYSGLSSPFTLTAANYAFTSGGMSPAGVFAGGGIFISDGNGNTAAGGAFDSNNAGTVTSNTTINACTYSIDQITGRIVLLLNIGACSIPSGANPSTLEYAVYQTANGSAVMLELDSTSVSTGMAFQQALSPTLVTGGFGFNLVGQGLLYKSQALIQQVLDGQVTLSGTAVTSGKIDINNFGAVFPNDPLNGVGATTVSSFTAPAPNGRGTAVLAASNPGATYNLSYYLIDDNTALFFDLDKTVTAIGAIGRQF